MEDAFVESLRSHGVGSATRKGRQASKNIVDMASRFAALAAAAAVLFAQNFKYDRN